MMLRPEPYRLAVELARGQATKTRNLMAMWEHEGWEIPADLAARCREWAGQLCQTIQASTGPGQGCQADQNAVVAIQRSLALGDQLTLAYSSWRLERRKNEGQAPGLGLVAQRDLFTPTLSEVRSSFSSILLPIDWSRAERDEEGFHWDWLDQQVDECLSMGLAPTIGPILDFHPGSLPASLRQWQSDPETLAIVLMDIVESLVGRYQDRVTNWVVSSGTNSSDMLPLSTLQRQYLTCRLLQAARGLQPEGQFAVGLDQPWGWYAGRSTERIWPVEFMDGVLRLGGRPNAILLDVRIRCEDVKARRSLLDVSKLLDRYRRLGTHLWVQLATDANVTLGAPAIEPFVVTALAKPFVERVLWMPTAGSICSTALGECLPIHLHAGLAGPC
jgi:hypothetical protein